MTHTLNFYKDLPAFDQFEQVTELSHFREAPEDWAVVLTDIKGSTQAIEQGRFREVNLMGAAGIVAVINALPEISIPSVFGGDGASMLVPLEKMEIVRQSLQATQKLAREQFQIELRAGAVPVRVLKSLNAPILVGKYQLGSTVALAQFRGGGLSKAEVLLKSGSSDALIFSPPSQAAEANLEGLSCRWEPIPHRKGLILTLIVSSRQNESDSAAVYRDLLSDITRIVGSDLRNLNPVTEEGLSGKVTWQGATREAKIAARGQAPSLGLSLQFLLIHSLAWLFTRFNLKVKNFDARKYKQTTAALSDFKKFDEMLRMVIDCTGQQADAIEKKLQDLQTQGLIWFGTHRSHQALMTCVVFSTHDNHFHFIDGSHGGYAMAARKLKAARRGSAD
jgi:hypothetical protein